jgi:hypothetical protein
LTDLTFPHELTQDVKLKGWGAKRKETRLAKRAPKVNYWQFGIIIIMAVVWGTIYRPGSNLSELNEPRTKEGTEDESEIKCKL